MLLVVAESHAALRQAVRMHGQHLRRELAAITGRGPKHRLQPVPDGGVFHLVAHETKDRMIDSNSRQDGPIGHGERRILRLGDGRRRHALGRHRQHVGQLGSRKGVRREMLARYK